MSRQPGADTNLATIISSIATILFFILWSLRPDAQYDAIVNFITPVVAFLIVPVLQRFTSGLNLAARIFCGVAVTVAIMIFLPLGITKAQAYVAGQPGREARDKVVFWKVVLANNFSRDAEGWWLHNEDSEFAKSSRRLVAGNYVLRLDSPRNVTTWAGSKAGSVTDFYVSVDIDKINGPRDSYCGLIFRFENESSWLFFRLRDDQTYSISRHIGQPNHQQVTGPTANKFISEDGFNKIAILAEQNYYRFFVNDVVVYETDDLPLQSGGIELAAQAPQNPSIVTCAFDNFELRRP